MGPIHGWGNETLNRIRKSSAALFNASALWTIKANSCGVRAFIDK